METSKKIKDLRKERGLTQEQLALKSGVSKNAIWNYENEKREPSIEIIGRIASALDVSIIDLMNIDKNDYRNISHIAYNMGVPMEYVSGDTKEKHLSKYNLKSLFDLITFENITNSIKDCPDNIQDAICSLWYDLIGDLFPSGLIMEESFSKNIYMDKIYLKDMFFNYYNDFITDLLNLTKLDQDKNGFFSIRKITDNDIPDILEKRSVFMNNVSSLIDKIIIRELSDESKSIFEKEIIKSLDREE